MVSGALCVMTSGASMMPEWCAGEEGCIIIIYIYIYIYIYMLVCMYILYPTHTYARLKEYVSYHVINPMPAQIKELGKVKNTFEGKLLPRTIG